MEHKFYLMPKDSKAQIGARTKINYCLKHLFYLRAGGIFNGLSLIYSHSNGSFVVFTTFRGFILHAPVSPAGKDLLFLHPRVLAKT